MPHIACEHRRKVIEIYELREVADANKTWLCLNQREQHLKNCSFAFFTRVPETGVKHALKFIDGHQSLLVLDLLVHGLSHVVEHSIVHAEEDHLLDDIDPLGVSVRVAILGQDI